MIKNKLSYSAISTYKDCARKYLYHYIYKLRENNIGSPLFFGSAVDVGLNELLTGDENKAFEVFEKALGSIELNGEKLVVGDHRITYSKNDFDLDVLSADTIKEFESTIAILPSLIASKKDGTIDPVNHTMLNKLGHQCLLAKGKLMIEAYKEQIRPFIKKILFIQKPFSISNDDGDSLIGFIDLIAEWDDGVNKGTIIFDHKTTSMKYTEDSVRTSNQLATYQIAEEHNIKVDYCGYIAINKTIRKKKEPRVVIQIVIDKIEEKLLHTVVTEYDEVNQMIKQGEFPRNFESCNTIYHTKCQFYKLCHESKYDGLVQSKSEKK